MWTLTPSFSPSAAATIGSARSIAVAFFLVFIVILLDGLEPLPSLESERLSFGFWVLD